MGRCKCKSQRASSYGLPQAALLAKQRLDELLAAHGYLETPTLCLYKHVSRPIMFTLVVDDFGIKSHGQEHLDHLLNTLRTIYTWGWYKISWHDLRMGL